MLFFVCSFDNYFGFQYFIFMSTNIIPAVERSKEELIESQENKNTFEESKVANVKSCSICSISYELPPKLIESQENENTFEETKVANDNSSSMQSKSRNQKQR